MPSESPSDALARIKEVEELMHERFRHGARFAPAETAELLAEAEARIERWAKRPEIVAGAARLQGLLGDYGASLRNMQKAVALAPRSAVYLAWRSELRRRTGDPDGALEDLDAAVALDPESLLAYSWRGRLKDELGKRKQALADFGRALRIAPDDVRARAWRAATYWKLGDCRRAALEFERIMPREPGSTWNRGVEADEASRRDPEVWKGRKDPFWTDLDEVVERRPKDPWAWAFRGRCLAGAPGAGGLDAPSNRQALRDLTHALQLDGRLAYAYRWRAALFDRLSAPAKAAEDRRRADELE